MELLASEHTRFLCLRQKVLFHINVDAPFFFLCPRLQHRLDGISFSLTEFTHWLKES